MGVAWGWDELCESESQKDGILTKAIRMSAMVCVCMRQEGIAEKLRVESVEATFLALGRRVEFPGVAADRGSGTADDAEADSPISGAQRLKLIGDKSTHCNLSICSSCKCCVYHFGHFQFVAIQSLITSVMGLPPSAHSASSFWYLTPRYSSARMTHPSMNSL